MKKELKHKCTIIGITSLKNKIYKWYVIIYISFSSRKKRHIAYSMSTNNLNKMWKAFN